MSATDEETRDFWRLVAAYFLPPLGVFMQSGFGGTFLLNLLLTFFFFLPGQLHAVWVISTTNETGGLQEEGGRTFLSLLLAMWLPPVGVFLKRGVGMPLLINIVLCWLMWFPGVVHGVWVISHSE